MMRTLRGRLLAAMLASIALLLALFGVLVYVLVRHALVGQFDAALASAAHTLAASVDYDDQQIEVEVDPTKLADPAAASDPLYYQFWIEDGTLLARSASLGGRDLSPFHGDGGRPACRDISLPDGRPARAAGIRFRPVGEELEADERDRGDAAASRPAARRAVSPRQVVLVVARDFSPLAGQLAFLAWFLLLAGAATMAVALLVAAPIVRRGLRPLNALAADIAAVRPDDLAARAPSADMPGEIRPIAERLNDLLGRLQAAFDRERAFTADVAHELRTPLAGVRATIEVALSARRPNDELREALADCLAIATQMQTMVENLLTLARLEAGRIDAHCEPVELAPLADACWGELAEPAARRQVTFENRLPLGLACRGDREQLRMVLTNLLANAAEYAEPASPVTGDGAETAGRVELRIANRGCGLTRDEVGRVFDRFWRADAARCDTGIHCGLGLPLVRRIVESLGGSAAADVDEQGRFTVRIMLPTAQGRPEASDAADR